MDAEDSAHIQPDPTVDSYPHTIFLCGIQHVNAVRSLDK